MKLTIRRIKIDSQGYDRWGCYWGTGERIYTCDQVEDQRELTAAWFRESSVCRAPSVSAAREIFKARMERMQKPTSARSFWTGVES